MDLITDHLIISMSFILSNIIRFDFVTWNKIKSTKSSISNHENVGSTAVYQKKVGSFETLFHFFYNNINMQIR
jgi:hypothetical protein